VVLDPDHPALIGPQRRRSSRFLGLLRRHGCVKDVIVGGEIVVRDRQHIREDAILRDFRAAIGQTEEAAMTAAPA
jgi:cytosine/adenosine deaminase-related metal-dependent hydrolase